MNFTLGLGTVMISTVIGNSFNLRFLFEILKKLKINLWLTAPKADTLVYYTSATDWQMAGIFYLINLI